MILFLQILIFTLALLFGLLNVRVAFLLTRGYRSAVPNALFGSLLLAAAGAMVFLFGWIS